MTQMGRHRRYIECAIKVARTSSEKHRYRVGCVIVNSGVLVGIGHNDPSKTHPRAAKGHYRWPTLHAELAAMIGVSERDLWGAVAYVARIRRITRTGCAKPCAGCRHHLSRMGVNRVYYTMDTEEVGFLEIR